MCISFGVSHAVVKHYGRQRRVLHSTYASDFPNKRLTSQLLSQSSFFSPRTCSMIGTKPQDIYSRRSSHLWSKQTSAYKMICQIWHVDRTFLLSLMEQLYDVLVWLKWRFFYRRPRQLTCLHWPSFLWSLLCIVCADCFCFVITVASMYCCYVTSMLYIPFFLLDYLFLWIQDILLHFFAQKVCIVEKHEEKRSKQAQHNGQHSIGCSFLIYFTVLSFITTCHFCCISVYCQQAVE